MGRIVFAVAVAVSGTFAGAAPSAMAVQVGERRTAAPTATRAVRLPGNVEDLAAPGGSLRVITNGRDVTVRPVGRAGTLGVPTTIPGPSPYDEGAGRVTALTASGALSAYRVAGPSSRIDVVETDLAGAAGVPESIPGTERGAGPFVAAGGGTAAVVFAVQVTPSTIQLQMAFRGAGEARFRAPVPLDEAVPGDLTSPVGLSPSYVIRFGDDGSGALIVGPEDFGLAPASATRLRRIAPDGTLGPWIPVGTAKADAGRVDLAVGPDGTIAIARSTQTSVGTGKQRRTRTAIEATSLPVGADAVTPVQRLAPGDDSGDAEANLTVAIGRGRRTVVADSGSDPDRVDVFTGRAGRLKRSASFRAYLPSTVLATVTPDGGVTVAWTPGSRTNTGAPIMAARQSRGRRFSKPAAVARTRTRDGGVTGQLLVPTRRGVAALVFSDEHEDDTTSYLSLLS